MDAGTDGNQETRLEHQQSTSFQVWAHLLHQSVPQLAWHDSGHLILDQCSVGPIPENVQSGLLLVKSCSCHWSTITHSFSSFEWTCFTVCTVWTWGLLTGVLDPFEDLTPLSSQWRGHLSWIIHTLFMLLTCLFSSPVWPLDMDHWWRFTHLLWLLCFKPKRLLFLIWVLQHFAKRFRLVSLFNFIMLLFLLFGVEFYFLSLGVFTWNSDSSVPSRNHNPGWWQSGCSY